MIGPTAFRLIFVRPRRDFENIDNLYFVAGAPATASFHMRLFELPLVGIVVDETGAPVWGPTLFLAETAIRSRSITGDTVRTYGEALLPWLQHLKVRDKSISQATEELLGEYRAMVSHMRVGQEERNYASSTVNLRVVVPAQFHLWGQRKGVLSSPLGAYLEAAPPATHFQRLNSVARQPRRNLTSVRTQRVIRRLPTALSIEQVSRILGITPMPYCLMLRWCLATGMRRVEVANLRLNDLPSPEEIAQCTDGLFRMQILRKGGREHTVHIPLRLLEETNWFVLADRSKSNSPTQNFVFLNRDAGQVSRQSLTRTFRRSADSIGTTATLHHLRHTFAVHVLSILERKHAEGETLNSIKTLQVLLGHASLSSTEIYLQAMQTSSDAVIEALDYLYGADL